MVQRPRPDLRGGCAAMRVPTATAGGSQQWGSLPRSLSAEGYSFRVKPHSIVTYDSSFQSLTRRRV